jgi:hypothetical protein
MPKPAQNKLQTSIQIFLPPDDKKAFSRWCESNGMTMSEVIRSEIKSKIEEGYRLK